MQCTVRGGYLDNWVSHCYFAIAVVKGPNVPPYIVPLTFGPKTPDSVSLANYV